MNFFTPDGTGGRPPNKGGSVDVRNSEGKIGASGNDTLHSLVCWKAHPLLKIARYLCILNFSFGEEAPAIRDGSESYCVRLVWHPLVCMHHPCNLT
jgi:hypothetical protein